MNKIEYFKAAMKSGLYKSRPWLISAFSLTREAPNKYLEDPYYLRLVNLPTGHFYVSEEASTGTLKLEKIIDATPNQPLFSFKDTLTVDHELCENVDTSITTTIGQVLFNLIVLVHAFGSRFPFKTGRVAVSDLEKVIAAKLKDTPEENTERDPKYFYVDEYIKFCNALFFLPVLSQLCVWSNTEKNVTAPSGLKEFKKQLLIKYEGKLHDPVELTKFEKELSDFDNEYLKDDPSNGTFISGKIKNNARKKMFLTMGATMGFETSMDVDPVINSLNEGWPKDPKQFTAMMNNSRAGSYSRGKETQKGGVAFKVLLRAVGNIKIIDTDCGSKLGIRRIFDQTNSKKLLGREILIENNWKLIESEEEASKYVGKKIIVRSPMFCKLDGDNLCKHCAGQRLSQNPTGVSMALTNVSSIIMTDNLKVMHGSVLSTAKMDIEKTFT